MRLVKCTYVLNWAIWHVGEEKRTREKDRHVSGNLRLALVIFGGTIQTRWVSKESLSRMITIVWKSASLSGVIVIWLVRVPAGKARSLVDVPLLAWSLFSR